jgi:hypothetical protein
MAKKMTIAEKAKLARDKASGTKKINVNKKRSIVGEILGEPSTVGRNVRVLNRAGKVQKVTGKVSMSGELYDKKATVKKVDADAYDMLSKLAKGKALKGAEAERAIQKAFKIVAPRMKNDRERTASRAEFIARRESKKRGNTNLS